MNKILLMKGISQYNVLRYWTDALAVGFEKLGIEVDILDLKYSDKYILEKYFSNKYDCVIAFNGYMFESKEFSDSLNCPFIYLLVDHPIDHLLRIRNLRQGDILTLMDRYDVNNLYQFGYELEDIYMLPHAAMELAIEKKEKTIDILISGTYSDSLNFTNYIESLPPIISNICKEVIEKCLEDSSKYYIEEFLKAFEVKGIPLKLRLNENPEFIEMVREIGRYIYSTKRLKVVLALAEAGFKLDIYGKHWGESPLVNYKNVNIHKPVNFWEMQELMKSSKIVVSFQALLRDGTHERIFAGMAAQSVVLTNETPYLHEIFKENEEILFYNFDNLEEMVQKVKGILEDEERQEKLAEAGWYAIKGNHTFEERAKQIVDIYNDVHKNLRY
ncbi:MULTISPECIES: glycosyltransferase [Lysinibacillus]|uniref:glycosyltransferase family protein n=1 Tax=Lysinibacillus TaxID=400634 RepID=UPI001CBC9499|nr:glycosyltransferase [Lysinibacillus sphaericus]